MLHDYENAKYSIGINLLQNLSRLCSLASTLRFGWNGISQKEYLSKSKQLAYVIWSFWNDHNNLIFSRDIELGTHLISKVISILLLLFLNREGQIIVIVLHRYLFYNYIIHDSNYVF